jgi:hypothetical protein
MKDPEGQTIECTQYMPGSRHYEDRGKHLGGKRVALLMAGATSPARDAAGIRGFYLEKLGFTEIDHGIPARLRMPGDSGQEVDIAAAGAEVKPGIRFGVADIEHTAGILTSLGLAAKATPANTPTLLTVDDPDGAVISFAKAALPEVQRGFPFLYPEIRFTGRQRANVGTVQSGAWLLGLAAAATCCKSTR